ncbi:MAG TPA: hypothetical protein VGP68_00860 [Gemmataceae bacterium]|jgi:Ca2+-binding EF-hand superfamily protein|nr:hypothetical protein [Gemmataceae bacterium]
MIFAGLLGLCLLQGPVSPVETPDPIEFLVLGKQQCFRLGLSVELDGSSLGAAWKNALHELFADLDLNGDGSLDRAEAARAPGALRLRQLGWSYLFAVPKSAPWDQLDVDHDGRVSFAEFLTYYRRHGLGLPIVGVGQFAPTAKLNEALLKQLSHDKTGQVSRDEWIRADKILAAIDADQDEMIRPDEILARTPYPGSLGGLALVPPVIGQPQPRLLHELLLLSLPADRLDAGWAKVWMARRGRTNELSIARSGLSPSLGQALDRNGDGKLDEQELLAWRNIPPEVNRNIGISKHGPTVTSAEVKDSPNDAVLSVHGDVHLIVHVVPGRLPEEWAKAKEVALQRFQQADANHDGFVDKLESAKINYAPLRDHFQFADRDGNGKISRDEWENYLRLRGALVACQVHITVLDSGPSLFEALDSDADGALSVRELRGAWQRLEKLGCITAGKLDLTKLPRRIRFVVSLGPPVSLLRRVPREGPAWFVAMDRNNDGDVSRREFLGDEAAFRKLDTDGDGLISRAEAEKGRVP